MSCFHPLSAWNYGINPETGKKIISFSEPRSGNHERIEIPCGRCVGCRLDYARQWANRCMLELEDHDRACFITLTYDEFHVSKSYYPDPATGLALPALTLCKRDLQLFFKRLRKAFPENRIRYFGCGEYGPSTFRPHYHVILFGIDFSEDRQFVKKSKTGYPIYQSKALDKVWSFPPRTEGSHTSVPSVAGICTVQEVNWETCCYCARYVTKKLNDERTEGGYDFYETFNIERPFAVMSRRPGIGRRYYDRRGSILFSDSCYIHLSTPTGGLKFKPPKYFDRLLEEDDPDKYEELKETRKLMSEAVQAAKLAGTDLGYYDYLNLCEDTFQSRVKALKRGDF